MQKIVPFETRKSIFFDLKYGINEVELYQKYHYIEREALKDFFLKYQAQQRQKHALAQARREKAQARAQFKQEKDAASRQQQALKVQQQALKVQEQALRVKRFLTLEEKTRVIEAAVIDIIRKITEATHNIQCDISELCSILHALDKASITLNVNSRHAASAAQLAIINNAQVTNKSGQEITKEELAALLRAKNIPISI